MVARSNLKLLRVKLREDDNTIIDLRDLDAQDIYMIVAVDSENRIREMFTIHGRYLKQQNFITFQSLKKLLRTLHMAGVKVSPLKVEVIPLDS
jgi:predicted membrane-bound spermidine synthase